MMPVSPGDLVVLVGPCWGDDYLGKETIVLEDQGPDLLCGVRELLVLDPNRPRQMRVYEFDVAPQAPASSESDPDLPDLVPK